MKFLLAAYLAAIFPLSDHEYEYIRIVNLQRKPIVEGTLNGKRAYFLLDTGSDFTILNERGEARYGFTTFVRDDYRMSGKALGVGGRVVSFKYAKNASIGLGHITLSASCRAYDMSRLVSVIRQKSGIVIAGIIGSDVMKRYGVIIDYGNREVAVLSGRKPDPLPLKPVKTPRRISPRR